MKKFLMLLLFIAGSLQSEEEQLRPHILQVSGKGEVRIKASVADVRLGVEVEAKRSQEAQAALTQKLNRLIAALRQKPLERLDTSSFSVNPEYSNTNPPEIKGYRGKAEITFRAALEEAGSIMADALEEGATQVYGIELKADEQQLREARQEALRRACSRAVEASQTVLQALSLEQREIVGVIINPMDPPPVIFRSRMATFSAIEAKSGPELEGEQTVDAQVALNIEFREKN